MIDRLFCFADMNGVKTVQYKSFVSQQKTNQKSADVTG